MNFANSLLKDIKSNDSFNSLGNKLKNISQNTTWIPDTKDILNTATSTLFDANPTQSLPQQTQVAHQIHNARSNNADGAGGFQSTNKNEMPKDTFSPKNVNTKNNIIGQKPIESSISNSNAKKPVKFEEQQPEYETSDSQLKAEINKSDKISPTNIPKLNEKPTSRIQPQVPIKSTNKESNENVQGQKKEKLDQIDPMQYDALLETNQALKIELQRLSVVELKNKTLEKELKNLKFLKDTNEKLEAQIKELIDYKNKVENIENKIKGEEERYKTSEHRFKDIIEKLKIENENLKNKNLDLEKLIHNLEKNSDSLRSKQTALEMKNELLENDMKSMNEKASKNEFHNEKLSSLEQANRILEKELEELKEQHKIERMKLKEKMDLLITKNNAKIKKLEEENRTLQDLLTKNKEEYSNFINDKREIEALQKRIHELENCEKANADLQKTVNQLQQDIQNQKRNYFEEKKIIEKERKSFNNLNEDFAKINDSMIELSKKHDNKIIELETRINNLIHNIEEKEAELNILKSSKEVETSNFLSKLSILSDENNNLANQLKNLNIEIHSKDDELNKLKKLINEIKQDRDKLQAQLNSYQHLENELVETHLKNASANEKIHELEVKLEEIKNRYDKDINEFNNANQHNEIEIRDLRQKLTSESLKSENLNEDNSLLKLELNKMENYKVKCEKLEKQILDIRNETLQISQEANNSNISKVSEKYENEIKLLKSQMINLQNDLRVKNQEIKQVEKLLEAGNQKSALLTTQLEDLSKINSQLTMQNSDAKRRVHSADLLSDECNQLRKNLTLVTIESESRKAEISALNSQICLLEGTVKSLRESLDKSNHLESNYESASYELKKKQEDLKKLQQLHESVKKEQLDTIELLEDKLRDIEKKTELQALKHEEILLELESIRARRERLLPICPNCSSQTLNMYQPLNSNNLQYQQDHQAHQYQQLQQCNHQSSPVTSYLQQSIYSPQTSSKLQKQQPLNNAQDLVTNKNTHHQLLSISIPQASLISSNNVSPALGFSPNQLQQLQANLSQLQVITLPGKQFVTIECQTSPTRENSQYKAELEKTLKNEENISLINDSRQIKKLIPDIVKSNACSQTINSELNIPQVNKEVNTDPIDYNSLNQSKYIINKPTPSELLAVIKKTRNQAVNVNLYEEIQPKVIKNFEEKSVQSNLELVNEKEIAFLYTCKYSYDPFKNSPNENPHAELPLSIGEYLFILKEEDDDGFFMGELINGKKGLVPSNFVEPVNLEKNLNKLLQALPKDVLTHEKFKDCLSYYKLDGGQVILAAQQIIQQATSCSNIKKIESVPSKQQISTNNQFSNVDKNTSTSSINEINQNKIGLPFPSNIKIEKRSENNFLVTWNPPTASISVSESLDLDSISEVKEQLIDIQTYNLYLNHELYKVINGNQQCSAILENVHTNKPNRISIQAVDRNGGISKQQECTLVFGSNRSFSPSGLSIQNLTQNSGIVTWWPSSSSYSHIISCDGIEQKTLRPGVYRYKIIDLMPETSHLLTVTAKISNQVNESSSNYSSSIEFKTLPVKKLRNPQDLNIEKDHDSENYILSWNPVTNNEATLHDIEPGGYSIYIDGKQIHKILNPNASSLSLSPKLLLNGASFLTMRTLNLDGTLESNDSESFKLSKLLNQNFAKKKTESIPTEKIAEIQSEYPVSSQLQLTQNKALPYPQSNQKYNLEEHSNIAKSNQTTDAFFNQKKLINEPPKISTTQQIKLQQEEINKSHVEPFIAQNEPFNSKLGQPQIRKPTNTPNILNQIPKVSDVSKRNAKNDLSANNDADLYENSNSNKNGPNFPSITSGRKVKSSRQNSPNSVISNVNINNKPHSSNVKKSSKEFENKPKSTTKNSAENNFRVFIALFDYDPFKMSPNTDSCSEELPFKEGQLIKIFGEQDADGFFYGESNGKRGYIPCNMVSEVQVDDPEVVKHLLNENQQKNAKIGNVQHKSTAKVSTNKHINKTQTKEQAFIPINTNNNQYIKTINQKTSLMIAIYDYEPSVLSPNADVDNELPFKSGETITVIGEMDEDGFYLGELNGKRGLVPSNFLQPIQR